MTCQIGLHAWASASAPSCAFSSYSCGSLLGCSSFKQWCLFFITILIFDMLYENIRCCSMPIWARVCSTYYHINRKHGSFCRRSMELPVANFKVHIYMYDIKVPFASGNSWIHIYATNAASHMHCTATYLINLASWYAVSFFFFIIVYCVQVQLHFLGYSQRECLLQWGWEPGQALSLHCIVNLWPWEGILS